MTPTLLHADASGKQSIVNGNNSPLHNQGNYPTTTAKIKIRREEIAIVRGSGASIDIDGRHSIVTVRTIVRRYGQGILLYGRGQR